MTRAELMALFAALGIEARTIEHPPVFRVGEGEELKATLPGLHTKNLFLDDHRGGLFLLSARDRARIDLKAVAKEIGSRRLSFGSPERLAETLGVTPGSVTAFALVNDPARQVRFLLDRTLLAADFVSFHPLENTATTAIRGPDFGRFLTHLGVTPTLLDFD